MNNGAFGENFPYSNFHDLNMDWIIKIAKDFLDQYTHIQELIDQGIIDITNKTNEGLDSLQDKYDTLNTLLNEWYTTHSQDIANQLASALADLNEWYTLHQNYLDQTLIDKLQEFNVRADTKAAETIASIPEDYTALSNKVNKIENELENGISYTDSAFWAKGANDIAFLDDRFTTNIKAFDAIKISTGDKVYIQSRGSGTAVTWMITDVNYTVLASHDNSEYKDVLDITQSDAYYLLVNCSETYSDCRIVVFNRSNLWDWTVYNRTIVDNLYDGYSFDDSAYWSMGANDKVTKITHLTVNISASDPIPVQNGDIFYIASRGSGTAWTWYLVDDSFTKIVASGSSAEVKQLIKVNNQYAKYLLINSGDTYLANVRIIKLNNSNESQKLIPLVNNYPSHNSAFWSKDANDSVYLIDNLSVQIIALDPIPVSAGDKLYIDCMGSGTAWTWYLIDANYNMLESSQSNAQFTGILEITNTSSAYLVLNCTNAYLGKLKIARLLASNLNEETADINKYAHKICCIGDSLTEGYMMQGSHYANYGDAPYPAQLKTLLWDNGYNYWDVENYGHGGENLADIVCRNGGFPICFTEDITIPANGDPVDITDKLYTPVKNSNNVNYDVKFTQLSHDTNPVYINGISYTMTITNNHMYIAKTVNDNQTTTILKNTLMFANSFKNANIYIVYGGVNDGASLTLANWIKLNKSMGNNNGGRYLVIGATRPLWNNWSDITGTDAEKYQKYVEKANEEFGVRFIDLYKDFFQNALPYALSAGYFSDKTTEELQNMRTLLNQHIIPAEFSYDNAHQGDVHLNKAGYYVMAKLIYDRLIELNYI